MGSVYVGEEKTARVSSLSPCRESSGYVSPRKKKRKGKKKHNNYLIIQQPRNEAKEPLLILDRGPSGRIREVVE